MAGRTDISVRGNKIIIDGVPPIIIQDMEKWNSMSLIEKSDAVQEIFDTVKPRRVGRAALQGATFGFSDEAIAAASNPRAAMSAAISGETEASAPYYETLEAERRKLDQFSEQYPVGAAISEFSGAAIPAVAATVFSGGSAAPATGTRMAQMLKSGGQAAKVGAIEGGLYGFGTGEGGIQDRLTSSAAGAALGAVFSPLAQAATYPIAVSANALIDTAKAVFGGRGGKAVEAELQRLAEGTGDSIDVIAQKVADGEIMAENETLRMTVRSLMAKGGQGETMVRNVFDPKKGRPQQTRSEAMAEIENYLARDPEFAGQNPKKIQQNFDAAVKKAESDAYSKVPGFKSPANLDVAETIENAANQYSEIANELNTFITGTSKGTKLIEKVDGKWELLRSPTLEEGEAARRYFREKSRDTFGKPVSQLYSDVRNELESLLNKESETLASVRKDASKVRNARDAYKYGLNILNRSSDDVDLFLADIIDDEAAIKSLRAGSLAHIRQKIEQAGGTNLMNKLQDETTREGKVFRAIFPKEQFDETLASIERAARSQSAMGDIIKGPTTALVQEASKRTGSEINLEDLTNITNPMTVLRVGGKIAKQLDEGLTEKQRIKVLEVLLSEDPDVVRRALLDDRGMQVFKEGVSRIAAAFRQGLRRGATQQGVQQVNEPLQRMFGAGPQ